jgi:hypothetical protein
MEMAQIMECGKPHILPVAGPVSHRAVLPVVMLRESDASMRRDGYPTAQTVPITPPMSKEKSTAHHNQMPQTGQQAL